MTAQSVAFILIAVVIIVAVLFLIGKAVGRAFLAERQMRERQTSELQNQLAGMSSRIADLSTQAAELSDKLDLSDQKVSSRIADLSAQAAELSDKLELSHQKVSSRIADLSAQVVDLSDKLELSDQKALSRIADLSAQVVDLSDQTGTLSDLVEAAMRTPPIPPRIESELLQGMNEAEMVALAESIATLRPLVPYPRWRFDADWANPDRAFEMRQNVWRSFRDRASEVPIVIGWHLGTRLQLHLGNDLSRQIYIAGCIDPNEFAFLDRYLQPGMTFFDAGANEGVYTVFAAKRLGSDGTVWAFEPSQREFARLRSNLDLNGDFNGLSLRLFPLALADRCGRAELSIARYEHAGQNTLGAFAYEGVATAEKQMVDLERLDDLVAKEPPARIDVIKLDVEGAELLVLEGAASTLQRYRPVLLLEVSQASLSHQSSSRKELLTFLRAYDYSLYLFDDSGLPACAPPGTYADNMLAVPQGTALPPAVFELWPRRSDPQK